MKGYHTGYSYVGWMPDGKGGGRWMYFATESEYHEAYNEHQIQLWKQKLKAR